VLLLVNLVCIGLVVVIVGFVVVGLVGLVFYGFVLVCLLVNWFFFIVLGVGFLYVVLMDEFVMVNVVMLMLGMLVVLSGGGLVYLFICFLSVGDDGDVMVLGFIVVVYFGLVLLVLWMLCVLGVWLLFVWIYWLLVWIVVFYLLV